MYVQLDASPSPSSIAGLSVVDDTEKASPDKAEGPFDEDAGSHVNETPPQERPVRLFIAHGKKARPLTQLEKILDDFGIPHAVAEEEAHAGRPISAKVAALMRSCTAGIFLFTADDVYTDAEGNEVHLPRQNVVYELGAASLLYGRAIVIFKEERVSLASDFSDLGHIEFTEENLEASAMELFRELLALGAVKIVSATAA